MSTDIFSAGDFSVTDDAAVPDGCCVTPITESIPFDTNDFALEKVKEEFLDVKEIKDECSIPSVDIKEEPQDLYDKYGASPVNVRLCL